MKKFTVLFLFFSMSTAFADRPDNDLRTCQGGITTNSGAVGIGQIGSTPPGSFTSINTSSVAQSFVATSATSFTVVSLNLDFIAPNGLTPDGSIQVDIEPDAATPTEVTAGTATSPAGAETTLGTAAIRIASIPYSTPQFVSFTFPSAITLTVGHIYWIVATPTYPTSSIIYVEWRTSVSELLNQVADYFSSVLGTWSGLGSFANMDFKVGC